MKFFKSKLFPCLLALVLLVSVVPLGAAAETGVVVNDEQGINDAIAAIPDGGSGTITISNVMLGLANSIYIYNKDVTINMVDAQVSTFIDEYGDGFPAVYAVDSNITINMDELSSMRMDAKGFGYGVAQVENSTYNTTTGAFDEEYTLTVNGGKYSCQEDDVVFVALPGTTVTLTNVLAWGGVKTEDWAGTNINIPGELVIGDGCYHSDITDYVVEGKFVCNAQNKYYVRDKEFSDEFKALFPDEKFVFYAAKPTEENNMTAMLLSEQFNEQHGPDLFMYVESFDADYATCEVVLYENTAKEEIHAFPVEWVYDPATKNTVDGILAKFPKGKEVEPGEFLPYMFPVSDMELFNYWLTCNEDTDNIGMLINYSKDFKEAIDYKNFFVDVRMGDNGPFYTFAGGLADFRYNDVSYAAQHIEVKADHVLYVPTGTANDPQALKAAADKRINEYVGEGKVVLQYLNTVYNVLDEEHFANTGEHLPTDINWEDELWVTGVTGDDHVFAVTINGMKYMVVIKADSAKILTPTYRNVDVATDVTVSAEDASVPLDTNLRVEKLEEGDTYDKLMETLDVEDSETFDINLYSKSLNDFVKKLDNGKFEVKIPVPDALQGETLAAYYVDEDGEVTEIPASVNEDGFAVFETNHFSIYTLAKAKTVGWNDGISDEAIPQPDTPEKPETVPTDKPAAKPAVPQTGDSAPLWLFIILMGMSGAAMVSTLLFRKKEQQ